jgi:hypothetical protein
MPSGESEKLESDLKVVVLELFSESLEAYEILLEDSFIIIWALSE